MERVTGLGLVLVSMALAYGMTDPAWILGALVRAQSRALRQFAGRSSECRFLSRGGSANGASIFGPRRGYGRLYDAGYGLLKP